MAVLVTQPTSSNQSEYPDNKEAIDRINKNDMAKPIDYNINVERYNGPLRPKMSTNAAKKTVMSLKILAETAIVSTRAREMDFLFLKVMSNYDNCLELNGYNTQIC